jgi:hypothetical protein
MIKIMINVIGYKTILKDKILKKCDKIKGIYLYAVYKRHICNNVTESDILVNDHAGHISWWQCNQYNHQERNFEKSPYNLSAYVGYLRIPDNIQLYYLTKPTS